MAVSKVQIETKTARPRRAARAANSNSSPTVGNVEVLHGANPTSPTISDSANERYRNAGLSGQLPANNNEPPDQNYGFVEPTYINEDEPYQTNFVRKSKKKKRKKTSMAGKAITKAKVSAANAWIVGWVIFFYTTVQLPFAVVSTAGLGITAYIYSYLESVVGETVSDFVLTNLIQAGTVFSSVIRFIAERFYGIEFNPILLFYVPFFLVLILAALQLLICWFVYGMLGIKSLSGSAGGIKISLFLLALIGTATPVLNMFPLILLWTGFVWLRPK